MSNECVENGLVSKVIPNLVSEEENNDLIKIPSRRK